MSLLLFFVMAVMATSCSLLPDQNSDSLDSDIGWLHGNCLAIKTANISPNHQFTLIHLDNANTTEKAIIIREATNGEECYALLDDRVSVNRSAGYTFYTVKSNMPVNLAIGILRPGEVSISDAKLSYCTTTEGVNFSISKNGSEIWKGYYYLGYESESTCAPE
ncbi:hypothetical protein [Teredinibacter turnerae]|uniref:hypothetical protein n=1 Tax=Teredinibacter turnerae TaxID=2426 RepID=UPI0012BC5C87|nr:hypothetical protein [Teredinibacter turnerae]